MSVSNGFMHQIVTTPLLHLCWQMLHWYVCCILHVTQVRHIYSHIGIVADFCASRLVYRNNYNDSLVVNCTLVGNAENVTSSNITIAFRRQLHYENIDDYVSVLDNKTIQLNIPNMLYSHDGSYSCINKEDLTPITPKSADCFHSLAYD